MKWKVITVTDAGSKVYPTRFLSRSGEEVSLGEFLSKVALF